MRLLCPEPIEISRVPFFHPEMKSERNLLSPHFLCAPDTVFCLVGKGRSQIVQTGRGNFDLLTCSLFVTTAEH